MKAIDVCPSTLAPGCTSYSPRAVKMLFDGVAVSPVIDIDFESERGQQQAMENMSNMSISGAQEKFSAVMFMKAQVIHADWILNVSRKESDCRENV